MLQAGDELLTAAKPEHRNRAPSSADGRQDGEHDQGRHRQSDVRDHHGQATDAVRYLARDTPPSAAHIIEQPLRIVHRQRSARTSTARRWPHSHRQRISHATTQRMGATDARYRPATASVSGMDASGCLETSLCSETSLGMGETPSDRVSISACASPLACWSTRLVLLAGMHRHRRLPRVRCSTPLLSARCAVSCRDAHAWAVLSRECAIR